MRAILCKGHGDEDVLHLGAAEDPRPGPGQVLIAVAAAGVNRADLLQRRGHYPPPPGASPILGLECSGRVVGLGPGATGFELDDRVMALLSGGGYAELAVADAGAVMAVPARLSDAEAGALPEVFLTAFLNLFLLGGLGAGGTALVHGGSGGVGTAAIQLARSAGCRVAVTAGSSERCRRCRELGAELALDYHDAAWPEQLRAAVGAVDVVLDCVGGPLLAANLGLLADGGRLVVIGLMGGARAELDLRTVLARRLSIVGSTLRSRPPETKRQVVAAFLARFGAALADGTLRPVVDAVLPLPEVAAAHRRLAAGAVFGKLVLSTSSSEY